MAYLVDTNILVYAFDHRNPAKREIARALLREGIASGEAHLAHQSVCEFVAATTRPGRGGSPPLMTPQEARLEAELLLDQFDVLYPDEHTVRLAVRGWATYEMRWWDAHLWAYAEAGGLGLLYSEDYQHHRRYGTVLVVNPFV